MWRVVRDRLLDRLQSDPGVREALPDVERAVPDYVAWLRGHDR